MKLPWRTIGFASAGVMLVALLLPWVTTSLGSINGMGFTVAGGWMPFVTVAAIVLVGVGFCTGNQALVLGGTLAAALIAVTQVGGAAEVAADSVDTDLVLVSVGSGPWLLLGAALVALTAAIVTNPEG
jgi:hypothetical protein